MQSALHLSTILIVDDETILRSLYHEICESVWPNSMVIEAENGKEALEKTSCLKLDMIITDVNMPEMDGIEMLRRFRNLGITCPALVISGRSFETRDPVLEPCTIIAKPVRLEILEKHLRNFEEMRRGDGGNSYVAERKAVYMIDARCHLDQMQMDSRIPGINDGIRTFPRTCFIRSRSLWRFAPA